LIVSINISGQIVCAPCRQFGTDSIVVGSNIESLRVKFVTYASVKEENETLMTVEDFINAHLNGEGILHFLCFFGALLPLQTRTLRNSFCPVSAASEDEVERLRGLFTVADVNRDGVLDFSEALPSLLRLHCISASSITVPPYSMYYSIPY
jgi:hypothetical protein